MPQPEGTDRIKLGSWNLLQDDLAKRYTPTERSQLAANLIQRQGLSVIGTQEASGDQRDRLLGLLKGWRSTEGVNRVVFWDNAKLRLVDQGRFEVTKTVGSDRATWVKLRSIKTNRQFVVMSVHAEPYKTELHVDNVKQILAERASVSPQMPTIVTGDMNSDYHASRETIVKGLTKGGLKLSYDEATRRVFPNCRTFTGQEKQVCQTKPVVRHIDHVYVSKSIATPYWANVATTNARKASDHNPIVVSMVMTNRFNR